MKPAKGGGQRAEDRGRRLEGRKGQNSEVRGRKSDIRRQGSVLFTDRQKHDRDVTTIGAAMSRHDMPLPETPCRFENCKACYLLGLFVIE